MNHPFEDAPDREKPDEQGKPLDDTLPSAESCPGYISNILVPRDYPDGTPVQETPETLRALAAVRYQIEQLAKQAGLEVTISPLAEAANPPDNQRSKTVGQIADPKMRDEADEAIATLKAIRETTPNGNARIGAALEVRKGALEGVAKVIQALGELFSTSFVGRAKGKIKVVIGKWVHFEASGEADIGEAAITKKKTGK